MTTIISNPRLRLSILSLLLLSFAPGAIADSLAPQPTAFTAWIDFHKQSPDLPIWIERIESQTIQADGTIPQQTTCRIRFRHFPGLVDQVLLRIYFDDQPNAQPVLTAWSEIGNRVLGPQTLGQGLGLPSSETVTIPMSGVDYVDIQTPHSGATIRGVLALALRPAATSEGLDFAGATAPITDPFGNSAPAVTGSDDSLLFGRVKATLEPGVVPLGTINSPDQAAEFDFPLQQPPLIALLTFEILNADIANPPDLSVNGTDLGPVNVIVTDLADPALTASVEAARPDVVYRYGGWLKVQKVIPGSLLIAGTNSVIVSTPGNPAPVALRSIEIQLKYTQDAATP